MIRSTFALAFALTVPMGAPAQETRELGAHEHGHSRLDIAFEGSRVSMALAAPGDDIVGFEYEAETAEDRAMIDAALATLSNPLALFVMPEGAGCSVVEATAMLAEEEHDHAEEDHAEEDHAEDAEAGADAATEDHAEEGEHDDEARHSEFRAEYLLDCTDLSAIDGIDFAYFAAFPNAEEVDVQMISETGSEGFEVERNAPALDLDGRLRSE